MKKKFLFSKKLFLIPAALLLLCASAYAAESVPEKPAQRIVSLSPSTTEILFALGAGDQVAGVTAYCEHPAEARLKPKAGGFTNHNLEAVAALRPDLVVLTPNGGSQTTYRRLKEIGVPVLSLPFYSLEDLAGAFSRLGRMSGHEARAGQLIQELKESSGAVREAAKSVPDSVVYVTWREPLILAGAGTMEDEIVRLPGAVNAAADSRVRYPRWSEEALLRANPGVILDASAFEREGSPEEERKAARAFWSNFETLKAVREGRVYLLSRAMLPVPGPRTVLQIRAAAEILSGGGGVFQEEGAYERLTF